MAEQGFVGSLFASIGVDPSDLEKGVEDAQSKLRAAGEKMKDVGRTPTGGYAVVFVSPTQRAAETVAWFLRGLGQPLPRAHAVIPGIAAKDNDGSPLALAGVKAALLDAVPEGGRGLAVSHTPLIERAVLGISVLQIEPLAECEGVLLTKASDEGPIAVEQLRLPR